MIYYKHFVPDFVASTAHLSMLEIGAYQTLLDVYYMRESGIPEDQAHKLARARSDDEKAAVDAVLAEFFSLVDKVWRHEGADKQMQDIRDSEANASERGRAGAKGRWGKRTEPQAEECANEPEVNLEDSVGNAVAMPEQCVSNASAMLGDGYPLTINHKPLTINTPPLNPSGLEPPSLDWPENSTEGRMILAIREAPKYASWCPTPDRLAQVLKTLRGYDPPDDEALVVLANKFSEWAKCATARQLRGRDDPLRTIVNWAGDERLKWAKLKPRATGLGIYQQAYMQLSERGGMSIEPAN